MAGGLARRRRSKRKHEENYSRAFTYNRNGRRGVRADDFNAVKNRGQQRNFRVKAGSAGELAVRHPTRGPAHPPPADSVAAAAGCWAELATRLAASLTLPPRPWETSRERRPARW